MSLKALSVIFLGSFRSPPLPTALVLRLNKLNELFDIVKPIPNVFPTKSIYLHITFTNDHLNSYKKL